MKNIRALIGNVQEINLTALTTVSHHFNLASSDKKSSDIATPPTKKYTRNLYKKNQPIVPDCELFGDSEDQDLMRALQESEDTYKDEKVRQRATQKVVPQKLYPP